MPLDGLLRVCVQCVRIEDTSINPTGYRTTACEILDDRALITVRHYVASLRARSAHRYLRQVFELARWWPSQLVLGWNVDRRLYAACGHLLDDRRR